MGFPYWGDGKPLNLPVKSTTGMDYWGNGAPIEVIYNPVQFLIINNVSASAVDGATYSAVI